MLDGLFDRTDRHDVAARIRRFLPVLRIVILVALAVALVTIVFPALVAAQRAAF